MVTRPCVLHPCWDTADERQKTRTKDAEPTRHHATSRKRRYRPTKRERRYKGISIDAASPVQPRRAGG